MSTSKSLLVLVGTLPDDTVFRYLGREWVRVESEDTSEWAGARPVGGEWNHLLWGEEVVVVPLP